MVPPKKIMKALSEIRLTKEYGIPPSDRHGLRAEPTTAEIQDAIDHNRLEIRDFQADSSEIHADIARHANGDPNRMCRLLQDYHAQRVAYFAVNPWTDPITIKTDGELTDGGHRFRAARHLRRLEVEVVIID